MMISNVAGDIQKILHQLPQESLDLARLAHQPKLKERVEKIVEVHPLRQRILDELFGSGPLEKLLSDEEITEIIVNGHDSIWFEKHGEFRPLADHFLSPFTLSQFISRICSEAKMKLDLSQPFADGSWKGLRVHLAQAPLSEQSFTVCLRRHPKSSWRLFEFLENGFCTRDEADVLKSLIETRANFLVVGPTGSGKTSLLSALLNELPDNERLVVIEDTPEIKLPNKFSTRLVTRLDDHGVLKNFNQSDLVKQSLRMRPSRLVVGEVRGPEAKDLLLALSTGHSGSLGSLHASCARQALLRLEMLVQMGAPLWSLDTVRNLILLSLQFIVVVEMKNRRRRLEGVYKLSALEKFGFLLEKIDC